MNSGRIAIGFIIIIALAGMIFLRTSVMPSGYAASNENESTTASVTVLGTVSTTIYNTPVNFPNVDAGSSNMPATSQPILQIDSTTNVDVMVYANATNFSGAGYGFKIENMTINVSTTITALDNSSCNASFGCSYKMAPVWLFNETAPGGPPGKNETLGHYINIPVGQYPTSYSSNVRWCTQQAAATIDCD